MPSPWVQRAQRNELPPDAHGARAFSGRVTPSDATEPTPWSPLRIATDGGTLRTVADLQARIAREEGR